MVPWLRESRLLSPSGHEGRAHATYGPPFSQSQFYADSQLWGIYPLRTSYMGAPLTAAYPFALLLVLSSCRRRRRHKGREGSFIHIDGGGAALCAAFVLVCVVYRVICVRTK